MKKIAALLDLKPSTETVVEFAMQIAKAKNCKVELVHFIDRYSDDEIQNAKKAIEPYCAKLEQQNVACTIEILKGDFFDTVSAEMERLHVDLCVVGTHGKKGLKQNLFGSNILKLVQLLKMPTLVLQETSQWPAHGLQTILFPLAAHSRFEMKIEQTKQVMPAGGNITVYAIYKTNSLDDNLRANLELTQSILEKENIAYNLVEEDVQMYSVGYSRQTLAYLESHPVDAISIMAQVSKHNSFFGNVDKENIILNPQGIPVLCCNDGEDHF